MPFIYPHLALMPDAHLGKGATVGSVIPTLGAIIPAAVGVDIGCGMIAVRTQFTAGELPQRPAAAARRPSSGPCRSSAGPYNTDAHRDSAEPRIAELRGAGGRGRLRPGVVRRATGGCSWARSGSGNHFIEVTLDEADRVWLFLHSGSRGVGNKIAQQHIKVAQRAVRAWWIELPDPDLAYLVEGTDEFWPTSASCGGRSGSPCSTARR